MPDDIIAQKASMGHVVYIQTHNFFNRKNAFLTLGWGMNFKTKNRKKRLFNLMTIYH